jgi:hypothetical protein
VDPLAAEYAGNSVYAFSENRVVNSVELEGLEGLEIIIGYALFDYFTTGSDNDDSDDSYGEAALDWANRNLTVHGIAMHYGEQVRSRTQGEFPNGVCAAFDIGRQVKSDIDIGKQAIECDKHAQVDLVGRTTLAATLLAPVGPKQRVSQEVTPKPIPQDAIRTNIEANGDINVYDVWDKLVGVGEIGQGNRSLTMGIYVKNEVTGVRITDASAYAIYEEIYTSAESTSGGLKTINGYWAGNTYNLLRFNENVAAGMSWIDAASNTFSGVEAAK